MGSSGKTKVKNIVIIMIIYLAGIFMGAIDTGIVTPARTLIQSSLGVNEQLGIWMITIYTLAYASSIPVMGKIADRYGRKYIYLISILFFGLGSLLSGLSQYAGSFTMLLIARAIQAIGGGGIMPIATAEFGTTFPKSKRGVALGLVGGIYGIANIFGASAGSLILDTFGHSNWSYIFFVNLPITLFIIVCGLIFLPNNKSDEIKKIDYVGISILTLTILSLLYSLRSIDFLNFWSSITTIDVWLFFLIAIVLFPIFLYVEHKAEDPVINLSYFKNRQIVITLMLSFISGIILIGAIFVPQFSENSVMIASGSGGYYVIILGIFAGIGAPLSGRLIDRFGVKPILGFGFGVTILATLFLIFIAIPNPGVVTVVIGLILMGLGMGFSLGTPLNYMMLENTRKKESNSALATLSLIRSIGTTLAPSIMVAFLASAGGLIQNNITKDLPENLTIPPIKYAEEINNTIASLKQNPQFAQQIGDFEIPDFSSETEYPLNKSMSSSTGSIDSSVISIIKDSDVTTIAKNTETFYGALFNMITPDVVSMIEDNVQMGIDNISNALEQMNESVLGLNQTIVAFNDIDDELKTLPSTSFDGSSVTKLVTQSTLNEVPEQSLPLLSDVTNVSEMDQLIAVENNQLMGLSMGVNQLNTLIQKLNAFKNDIGVEFAQGVTNYLNDINDRSTIIENTFQSTLNQGFRNIYITISSAAVVGFVILRFYKPTKQLETE